MNKLNIVITGHRRGLGKKLYDYLSINNNVIGISRRKKKSDKDNIYSCDITNFQELKKIFSEIKKIDVLINNAGISRYSKNQILNFDQIVKTNLNGMFYCSTLAINKLNKSKDPKIINISSINAYQAFPNNPGYVASKGAVLSLTRSLALDYSKYRIKVNSISPGYFKTDMTINSFKNKKKNIERKNRTILERWGDPEDLIGIIDFLISNKSSYITGQDFVVDGGWLAKGL